MKIIKITVLLLLIPEATPIIISLIFGAITTAVTIVDNYRTKVEIAECKKVAEKAQEEARQAYYAAELAKEQAKEARKEAEQLRNATEEFKQLMPAEFEKTKKIINDMIDKHNRNHQEVLGTLYSIEEGVHDLQKAIYLLKIEEANIDLSDLEFIDMLSSFFQEAHQLDSLYQTFSDYALRLGKYNSITLQNFVTRNMAGYTLNLIRSLQSKLVCNRGIFDLSSDIGVEKYILMTRRMSALQFIQNTFSYYLLVEIRTISVVMFANDIAPLVEPEGMAYDQELEDYDVEAAQRIHNTLEVLSLYTQHATGRYWVYDSYKNPIGHNYITFTNFMRGFLFREKKCSNAQGTGSDSSGCRISNPKKCNGELISIDDRVDFSKVNRTSINICYSEDEHRNYEYVKFIDKVPQRTKCDDIPKAYTYKEGCDICAFLCYDKNTDSSDRYMSLDEMVSNVTERRIITGVRFNKYNGVIGLDIQETQIDESGCALPDTSNWIINKGKKLFALKPSKLHLYLGEIKTENKLQLVTGLRFVETDDGIELQTRFHELVKCSDDSCIITSTESWLTSVKSKNTIDLFNKELPNNRPDVNIPVKNFANCRVRVSPSDFKYDGAQTTLPFFDTREAVAFPPMGLWGIGWLYKGEDEYYGGYVAPYIVTKNSLHDFNFNSLPNLAGRSAIVKPQNFAPATISHLAKSSYYLLIINCIIMFFL